MKKLLLGLAVSLCLLSCGKTDNKSAEAGKNGKVEKLKVAATPIPAGELLKLVKDDLLKEGVDMEIVEFNDYVQPDKALQDKSVDANLFQHKPYMENFGKKNGFEMTAVGPLYLPTLSMYSDKVKSVDELKNGATIIVPNDPTNLARALLIMDKKGIIKVKNNKDFGTKLTDIVENKKNLKFVEMSADQIAPRYKEVDAAFINSSFALDAGLNPKQNGILNEDKDSPYANVLAVLKGNEKDPRVQKLYKVLQSEKVKKFIQEKYKDVIIPTF